MTSSLVCVPLQRNAAKGRAIASPAIVWDASTCEVAYSNLASLLRVDGLFVSHLLPALLGVGRSASENGFGSLPALPRIPTSFPRSVLAMLCVEANPRRRFALLQTLRVLAAIVLPDPVAAGTILHAHLLL